MSELRAFLRQPRSFHRLSFGFVGVLFIAVGIGFGIEQRFSNLGVVAFLAGAGIALLAGSIWLAERYLAWFAAFCIALNIAAASYALLLGSNVQR